MARAFSAAGSDNIANASIALVTDEPFTMASWFYVTDVSVARTIWSIGNAGSSGFWRLGVNASSQVFAQKQSDASANSQAVVAGVSINTWMHGIAVWAGDADRTVYLNGSGVNDTGSVADCVANRTCLGIQAGNLGTPRPFEGYLCESAIWSVADLTADEITALAKGFSPRLIRPNALLTYLPLIRNVVDIKGAMAYTTSGTTVVDHPRIIGL